MSQLDNTLYIDLIVMFLFWSCFIGLMWVLLKDTLMGWEVLIKYFWLNFICDLKVVICGYLITQILFGNIALKKKILNIKS